MTDLSSYRKRYHASKLARVKNYANTIVNMNIRSGKLKRLSCEICDPEQMLNIFAHAHHDSYRKEDVLKVRFLCPKHHKAWHKENTPKI